MSNKTQTDYDIIIAGGGMIGTSLGLALAPLHLRVAVIEAVARNALEVNRVCDRAGRIAASSYLEYYRFRLRRDPLLSGYADGR